MKLILSVFIAIVGVLNAHGQGYFKKGDFPEGVYMTIEDVLNVIPSSTEEVFIKSRKNEDPVLLPEKAFFYFKQTKKQVRFPLAVSYQGELYFQTYKKYTNKKDRGFEADAYSRYCRVLFYGRFLYFEENMKSFSGSALGAVSPLASALDGKVRGIVLDVENLEFNILRSCDDLNEFLLQHGLQEVNCKTEVFTIDQLRQMIVAINEQRH
ncbi:hypothetical protein ADIS_0051 [Lunatimonas lonarensis]|uniref:Uncharacterized protein n=1 Tax=Lunatimonas lonarensis TaxID=1232681 RepID=R7ZZK3_9BACT|nr:hypothetical protein [Lunatimonas lonarensis]EON79484.1 hypothetical protein ADIS_0051 [Lunatimonas lonarensis]